MLRLLAAGLALLLVAASSQAQVADEDIDDLVRTSLKQWHTPGLALVIVQDDRVVYLKGFGVKEVGQPGPVSPDTVFPIASCTKSFTALALGMLADDGKLDWDDPVRKHVPYFRLADPLADAEVTLRDLLTHRTGLGTHAPLWYRSPWPLEERIRRLGKLELERSFRSGFQYQTLAFGTAGVAAGKASGGSWEDLITRRILEPLGMKSARAVFDPDQADQASPHRKDAAGKVKVVPRYPLEKADPSGSIHASARDLGQYLRFQLGDGAWQGQRLLSAANLAEPHTPQIALRREGFAKVMNPETHILNYGMGWIVQDYRGQLMVMHGGAIDGFRAHLTLLPEARLGIGLLSNLDGGYLNLALSNSLTDLFLDLPPRDWSAYYLEIVAEEARQQQAELRDVQARIARSPGPPRPLPDYVGVYHDAAFGACKVALKDGQLVWSWNNVRCPLQHIEQERFLGNEGYVENVLFQFEPGPDGEIASLRTLNRTFRRE